LVSDTLEFKVGKFLLAVLDQLKKFAFMPLIDLNLLTKIILTRHKELSKPD